MPPKKKAVSKKSTRTTRQHAHIYWGAVFLVITLLMFFSLLVRHKTINDDFYTIRSANLTFGQVARFEFPPVQNPVGALGACMAYALLKFFGQFYAVCLVAGLVIIAVQVIFLPRDKDSRYKAVAFIILAFFANVILLNWSPMQAQSLGTLPMSIYDWLMSLLRATGTIVVSAAIMLVMLMIIFGAEAVKNVFFGLLKGIYIAIYHLFKWTAQMMALPFRQKEEEESPAPVKKKNTLPMPEPEDDEGDPREPNIYNHAAKEDKPEPPAPVKKKKPRVDDAEFDTYVKPDIDLFLENPPRPAKTDRTEMEEEIKHISTILKDKLAEFGIEVQVMNVNIGPIITQYELKPAPGVKVSRFPALADDLALAIKAKSIRVQAPIPGRGMVGIEVPNVRRDTIYLKDVLLCDEMMKSASPLALPLGKDTSGVPVMTDLANMPHLLIAGATGSGKSVCLNTMICSILLRQTPDEVRLVMIDPKMIELSGYEGIPHLIQKVVTDPDEALAVLNWGVGEMERRYELLLKHKARDIDTYNRKIKEILEKGEDPEDPPLPCIVMVVDEFADLIMSAGRDIELPIARLAQKARAIGIHLILATQRPSTKVITGLIKANFPARIAFRVSTKVDSRVILDQNGAETLLGKGDMLFLPPGKANVERIHGAFLSDREIEELVEYLRKMPKPDLNIEFVKDEEERDFGDFEYDDDLFLEAARAVASAGTASVSMLQRHFKIGYARAGRLIDMLEQARVIGPHVGSKSREVIMTPEDIDRYGA